MGSTFRMNQRSDHNPRIKSGGRPLYRLLLQPERDVDPEHALRTLLKIALRRLHLRCISIEKVANDGPR
jgi:hypothetical protein